MAVPDKVPSFFSRFTMKLLEIIGAGVATAVGGYLVAHLGAYLSSSPPAAPMAPAAVQTAPNATVVTKAPKLQPTAVQPVSAESTQQSVPAPEANPAKEAGAAKAAPSRKPAKNEATVVESKPAKSEGTAVESRPRDFESVEAEIRAALAKVDAGRPPAAAAPAVPAADAVPPAKAEIAPTTAAIPMPPKPADSPAAAAGSIAPAPPAVAVAPQPSASAPPVPAPLGAVEVKSAPVIAPVDAVPPAEHDGAQANAAEEGGFFSAIKKIPELLRPGAGATTKEPPRPPMPVSDGQ